jgi:hypothetical protein
MRLVQGIALDQELEFLGKTYRAPQNLPGEFPFTTTVG